jgi:hypothetical protein
MLSARLDSIDPNTFKKSFNPNPNPNPKNLLMTHSFAL